MDGIVKRKLYFVAFTYQWPSLTVGWFQLLALTREDAEAGREVEKKSKLETEDIQEIIECLCGN